MRTAAVLMAGMVGAALVAPGLASAETSTPPTTTRTAECATGSLPLVGSAVCDPASTTTPSAEPTTPDPTTSPSDTGAPALPSMPSVPLPDAGGVAPESPTDSSAGAAPSTDAPSTATESPSAAQALAPAAVSRLQKTLGVSSPSDATTSALLPTPDPQTGLIGLFTPEQFAQFFPAGTTFPSSPSTTNPQQACAFFGSQLVASDPSGMLGTQFADFCSMLPTSFGADGLTSLTDLVNALAGLLGNLPMGLPSGTGTATATTPPSYVPPQYAAYMSPAGSNIFNCGDMSQAAAQQLLTANPSDPNNFDANNNGIACESGLASYSGYPQGGVATGDSDPALDTAHAGAVALALVMTSGFAAAGAARRRDRADEVAGV